MTSPDARERWAIVHRICTDVPEPIDDIAEAQWVLTIHAGHGPECLQLLAALSRTSEVM